MTQPKTQITAQGLFSWMAKERISDRYGSFYLYEDSETQDSVLEDVHEQLKQLEGKRVKITATVIQVRECLHIGDLFHGFSHTVPEEGEEVELGVGVMLLEEGFTEYDVPLSIVLAPGEEPKVSTEPLRSEFWIDPFAMYRLCQQVVRIVIEETEEEFTKYPFWWSIYAEQEVPEWAKGLLRGGEGGGGRQGLTEVVRRDIHP